MENEDAAYILSFAIMMLHTSLHNPSVKHKTSIKLWVTMNRGEHLYMDSVCMCVCLCVCMCVLVCVSVHGCVHTYM